MDVDCWEDILSVIKHREERCSMPGGLWVRGWGVGGEGEGVGGEGEEQTHMYSVP